MKKIQFIFCFLLYCSFGVAQKSSIPANFKYCLLPGLQDSVYEGFVEVFENRSANSGKKIKLYVIIIPSINRTIQPPLLYVDGGPGLSSAESVYYYSPRANIYRQDRDIVLIDTRGTGKSNPLHCSSVQVKTSLQERFQEIYPADSVSECYRILSKENDLTQYNTTNAVNDFEEVREKLGYKKFSLFGLSYGGRLALHYMRLYPQSISSVVLWSPAPTYTRMPLYYARFAQNTLDLIWDDCKNDSTCNQYYPNIKREFAALMKRWKQKSISYNYTDSTGRTQQLSIPWDAFQTKIRSLMYSPLGIRSIPFLVHEAWKGNLTPYIKIYANQKAEDYSFAEGLYLCITCTEDVPFIRSSEIKSLTKNTFVGTYRIDQHLQACANWTRGNTGSDFLQPVVSTIPTLILSGSFDPVTPTSWAKEIADKLLNSKLVIFPYMAHVFDGLSNESCFDTMVVDFLNNKDAGTLKTDCVNEMLPPAYKIQE